MKRIAIFFALLLCLFTSSLHAADDEYKRHLDWAIHNKTNADQLNCPQEYVQTYPACLTDGGRSCLMKKAIESAKANDYNNAMKLSLIAQCHSAEAQLAYKNAGKQKVGDYLKTRN